MIPGVDIAACRSRRSWPTPPDLILTSDARTTSGNFFIDDTLLADHGVTDLERYSVMPGTKDFIPDFFVD